MRQQPLGGRRLGADQRVNTVTGNNQDSPSITPLANGGWLVTWTSAAQDGNGSGVHQQGYSAVAAFGQGKEFGSGSDGRNVFHVLNGGLAAGDSLDGGEGIDILAMIESGTLNLFSPDRLTGIEVVQGSSGNDLIIATVARIADIVGFAGGTGTDDLRLANGSYDFSAKFVSGIETITLFGTGSITFADRATALLTRSSTQDGTLILTGDSFSLAERTKLYAQGIRHVTDSAGVHLLQQAQASLSKSAVQENTRTGSIVGTLSFVDPNPGDSLSYQLIGTASGRFKLSGNKLLVANGALLDFEKAKSHTIVLRVTDEGGIVTDKTFTIGVDDILVETVKGTSRADRLTGGTGKDLRHGGLGKDTLTGGKGQDAFVFDTAPNSRSNRDSITDFSVRDDAIWLDNRVFSKLGSAGSLTKPAALKSAYFKVGDKVKGKLLYDADGSGTRFAAVEIATISKNLAMKSTDFFVV